MKISMQYFADGEAESNEAEDEFLFGLDDDGQSGLLNDETGEESTPAPDVPEETPPAEPPAETQQAEPEPEKYTFEANGKQVSMTMEELQSAAARTAEADEVLRQHEEYSRQPEVQLIRELAERNGMTPAQYMQAVEEQRHQQELEKMTAQGVPEEFARRMMELERRERERSAAEEQNRKEAQRRADYTEFVRRYPDVKEFPPEVIAEIKKGAKPADAYMMYENKKLREQVAAYQKTESNRQTTPGRLTGAGPVPEKDAFLSGFEENL